jgi:hypothetical protein
MVACLTTIPFVEAQVTAICYFVFAQDQSFREAVTMRQECCLSPTLAATGILDRLDGLSKVIPPELLEQALAETDVTAH